MKNLIAVLFMCLTGIFASVQLSLDNVDTDAGTLSVIMENDETVGGFQFGLDGVSITGASEVLLKLMDLCYLLLQQ